MHYRRLVLISTVASSATVQALSGFPNLPKCALDCALKSLEETKCKINDMRCLCSDAGIAFDLGPCVLTSCSIPDMIKTAQEATNACIDAGFEIKLPGFPPIDIGGKPEEEERSDSSYSNRDSTKSQDALPAETSGLPVTTAPSSDGGYYESSSVIPADLTDVTVTMAPTSTLAYRPPTPTSTKTVHPTITVLPGNGTSSAVGLTCQLGSELRGLSVMLAVIVLGLI